MTVNGQNCLIWNEIQIQFAPVSEKKVNIGSHNGQLPNMHQAIIWTTVKSLIWDAPQEGPCRRCSNYIFSLDLTCGFNGLGKHNCKPRQETFKFRDLVDLILEVWW